MDKFKNKVVGEDVDFPMNESGKSYEAPLQDVGVSDLKRGLTSKGGFSVENDDKFDNIPKGHDRV